MKSILESCQDIPCLKVITPGKLRSGLSRGQIALRHYGKNEIIHYDGDLCEEMEVITKGQVVVERIDEEGHLMTVTAFGRGQSIGANLVFSSTQSYPMTVTAKEEVTVIALKKGILSDLCTTNEDFLHLFLTIISDHTLVLGHKIKYDVNSSIRDKIIAYLSHQYEEQALRTIDLTMSKSALAQSMGVQRTSLSRELQKMKQEGLIDYDRNTITIYDKNILHPL